MALHLKDVPSSLSLSLSMSSPRNFSLIFSTPLLRYPILPFGGRNISFYISGFLSAPNRFSKIHFPRTQFKYNRTSIFPPDLLSSTLYFIVIVLTKDDHVISWSQQSTCVRCSHHCTSHFMIRVSSKSDYNNLELFRLRGTSFVNQRWRFSEV